MKINRFARYCWFVLLCTVAVILWGAYVRASGAGAGCGSHWPLCNGEVLPRARSIETVIEMTHRVTSGLVLFLIVGLTFWAFRVYQKKHIVRRAAAFSLLFILTEALVGAGLVLFELVADNASIARALFMSVHLVNTFLLMASLALTAWWASNEENASGFSLKGQGLWSWLCLAALVGAIVLGMSGAVAALGDTLFPANSLTEGLRQDWSPTAHLLIRLRLLHPTIAMAVVAYTTVIAALAGIFLANRWSRRFALLLIASLFVQFGLGLLNVILLAPIWLQLVHLLFANVVWVALVLLTATVFAEQKARSAVGAADSMLYNPKLKTVSGER